MRLLLTALAATALLGACAVQVDESSLIPEMRPPDSDIILQLPTGYARTDALAPVETLGVVHVVRLDRADNVATVIFAGGSGHFTSAASRRLARLAEITRADIITFDYPGRLGTTLPRTSNALTAMGPALVRYFRQSGWIEDGPVYAYGFSFGGASASNIARSGDFAGLILESTSSDIVAMGRNMVPPLARPLVRLQVDDDLAAFDYFGFAVAARAPIVLLAAREDAQADLETVHAFGARLRAAGADVTVVDTPGGHGDALYTEEAATAISDLFTH